MSVAKQFQPVPVEAGRVIAQEPVLLVPTFTRKAKGPLFAVIDAPEPPQPAAAILGAAVFSQIWELL
jgi:hypothetical protein